MIFICKFNSKTDPNLINTLSVEMSRNTRKRYLRRSKRRSNGGGWSDGPEYINAGNLVHVQYQGPGKDCAGVAVRPGYLNNTQGTGLPGLGKMFGGKRRQRKLNGGTSYGGNESINSPLTVSNSLTDKPADFPDTTGVGGTVSQPNVVRSTPGVSTELLKQAGGRYGMFPEMGPLNPSNGVGVSPAPFGRIPCESGIPNPLNPNPNNIQNLSTAPNVPPYVTRGGSQHFPEVQVGAADSMRYYAPTAGYSHKMEAFPGGSAVPGLMLNTPYDARAFNQACLKTGGARRRNKKGGYLPVGMSADTFKKVEMNQVMTRSDFDGTDKGLPVKFGGSRRRKSRRVTKRRSKKVNGSRRK